MAGTEAAMDPRRADALARWLEDQLGLHRPRLLSALGGGNSNVTLLIEDDGGRYVLRHPPADTISELAASGIGREATVQAALQDRGLPLPRLLGRCEDPSVIGAPFVVSEHVEGVAVTDELPPDWPRAPGVLTQVGAELVDAIAAVHRLDWRELPLPGFRPSSSFLRRQLERWLAIRARDSVRDLTLLETVAAELAARLPEVQYTALIHGDYHWDNTLFSTREPRLLAIIDWELATLGDPRLDVGLMLAFWGPRAVEEPAFPFVQRPTRTAAAPPREVLAARWSQATGIPFDDWRYFCAFAFWRLAAIVEGAYVLYRRGRVDSAYARNLEHDVPRLLEEARHYLADTAP